MVELLCRLVSPAPHPHPLPSAHGLGKAQAQSPFPTRSRQPGRALCLLPPGALHTLCQQACMRPLGKQGAAPALIPSSPASPRKPPSYSPVWEVGVPKSGFQQTVTQGSTPGSPTKPGQAVHEALANEERVAAPRWGTGVGVTGGHRGAVLKGAKDDLWGEGGLGFSYLKV